MNLSNMKVWIGQKEQDGYRLEVSDPWFYRTEFELASKQHRENSAGAKFVAFPAFKDGYLHCMMVFLLPPYDYAG
jgi:hypothetical protein